MTKKFFSPLSFVAVFGSGIREDPGSGINIPDPQHCCKQFDYFFYLHLGILPLNNIILNMTLVCREFEETERLSAQLSLAEQEIAGLKNNLKNMEFVLGLRAFSLSHISMLEEVAR
jgi:hypothetical protein